MASKKRGHPNGASDGASASAKRAKASASGPPAIEFEAPKLADIRDVLIRQEETIVFALIERAQFKRNAIIYKSGSDSIFEQEYSRARTLMRCSFLEYLLRETERLHNTVQRYSAPEEHAFFPNNLPEPVLPQRKQAQKLAPNDVNINSKIYSLYLSRILPELCQASAGGDLSGSDAADDGSSGNVGSDGGVDDNDGDGEYGSTAVCDIAILQALSKRVHYGKFVAEAKFQAERERYEKLIRDGDDDGIMKALTKPAVEKQVGVCFVVRSTVRLVTPDTTPNTHTHTSRSSRACGSRPRPMAQTPQTRHPHRQLQGVAVEVEVPLLLLPLPGQRAALVAAASRSTPTR